MKRIALACSAVIVLAMVASFTLGALPGRASSASPHIDLLFMSSQAYNDEFCTGSWPTPIHSPYRAIDVIGDNASLCYGDSSSNSKMRAWGFGGSSSHHTMGAWASYVPVDPGCDEIRIGMIDVGGGLHGELRWLHSSMTISPTTQMKLYAAPSPGATRTYTIGNTVWPETGCSGTTHHIHQGTNLNCMTVNSGLTASTEYPLWNYLTFINAIGYAEGLSACDG